MACPDNMFAVAFMFFGSVLGILLMLAGAVNITENFERHAPQCDVCTVTWGEAAVCKAVGGFTFTTVAWLVFRTAFTMALAHQNVFTPAFFARFKAYGFFIGLLLCVLTILASVAFLALIPEEGDFSAQQETQCREAHGVCEAFDNHGACTDWEGQTSLNNILGTWKAWTSVLFISTLVVMAVMAAVEYFMVSNEDWADYREAQQGCPCCPSRAKFEQHRNQLAARAARSSSMSRTSVARPPPQAQKHAHPFRHGTAQETVAERVQKERNFIAQFRGHVGAAHCDEDSARSFLVRAQWSVQKALDLYYEAPPLPSEWEQHWDPDANLPYYHNRITNRSQWMPPTPLDSSVANTPRSVKSIRSVRSRTRGLNSPTPRSASLSLDRDALRELRAAGVAVHVPGSSDDDMSPPVMVEHSDVDGPGAVHDQQQPASARQHGDAQQEQQEHQQQPQPAAAGLGSFGQSVSSPSSAADAALGDVREVKFGVDEDGRPTALLRVRSTQGGAAGTVVTVLSTYVGDEAPTPSVTTVVSPVQSKRYL